MIATANAPCDEQVIATKEPTSAQPCPPNVGRAVLVSTILASSMVFIDSSAVNVALPAIQREFGATAVQARWVVESYALFLATLILVGGVLGDRVGRKRIFLLGTVLFTPTSLWCGAAQSVEMLTVGAVMVFAGAVCAWLLAEGKPVTQTRTSAASTAQVVRGAMMPSRRIGFVGMAPTAVHPDGPCRTVPEWRPDMNDEQIRALLKRHWSDIEDNDIVHEIYHDVVLEFARGGERLVGLANVRGMREAYPATVSSPMQRIRGGGDFWVTELLLTYDGQAPTHAINIMEFRDGKVAHETIYFGEPWEPPAWRAPWVERMAPLSIEDAAG